MPYSKAYGTNTNLVRESRTVKGEKDHVGRIPHLINLLDRTRAHQEYFIFVKVIQVLTVYTAFKIIEGWMGLDGLKYAVRRARKML